jgi:hypothetical protein
VAGSPTGHAKGIDLVRLRFGRTGFARAPTDRPVDFLSFDEIAKSQKSASVVIPAKAGIQVFQFLMDSGMTKSGLFTIPSILSSLCASSFPC